MLREIFKRKLLEQFPQLAEKYTEAEFEELLDKELIKEGLNPQNLQPLSKTNKTKKIRKQKKLEIVVRYREEKNQNEFMVISSKARIEEAKELIKVYSKLEKEEIQTKKIEGRTLFLVYGIVKR